MSTNPQIADLQRQLEQHAKLCLQAEQLEEELSSRNRSAETMSAIQEASSERSQHSQEAKRLVQQLRGSAEGREALQEAEKEIARWRTQRGMNPGPMPGTFANY